MLPVLLVLKCICGTVYTSRFHQFFSLNKTFFAHFAHGRQFDTCATFWDLWQTHVQNFLRTFVSCCSLTNVYTMLSHLKES